MANLPIMMCLITYWVFYYHLPVTWLFLVNFLIIANIAFLKEYKLNTSNFIQIWQNGNKPSNVILRSFKN